MQAVPIGWCGGITKHRWEYSLIDSKEIKEDINTKNISLIMNLTTSEFSQVRSTSKNFDVLKTQDEIYLVFTEI